MTISTSTSLRLFELAQQGRLRAAAQAHVKQLICALWQATDYTDESLYRYARLAASYALDAYGLRQLEWERVERTAAETCIPAAISVWTPCKPYHLRQSQPQEKQP